LGTQITHKNYVALAVLVRGMIMVKSEEGCDQNAPSGGIHTGENLMYDCRVHRRDHVWFRWGISEKIHKESGAKTLVATMRYS